MEEQTTVLTRAGVHSKDGRCRHRLGHRDAIDNHGTEGAGGGRQPKSGQDRHRPERIRPHCT